jgi:hypothetical protein
LQGVQALTVPGCDTPVAMTPNAFQIALSEGETAELAE